MKEKISFENSQDHLLIQILSDRKPVVIFGFALKGIILLSFSVFFALLISPMVMEMGLFFLFAILYIILLFILGRNYINTVFTKEIIEVTKEKITIIDKRFTYREIKTFLISEISEISFVGSHKFTPHPLEGVPIDYMGLGAGEKEVQYIIDEGTIQLFYQGSGFRFGKNLPSWDAEIILNKIESFTGRKFTIGENLGLIS